MQEFKKYFLLLSMALLAGCSVIESSPMPNQLGFTRYQPILLDVGEIKFTEEYKSPQREPYVDYLMPYSPTEAMNIWIKDRLRAVGNEKTLEVIIKDGSVIATPLEKSGGVLGALGMAQDKRYDLKLVVEMRVYGREHAMSEASINVSTHRSIVMSDSLPLHEREVQFRRMMADSMEILNAELEKNMFMYFGNVITYQ